MAEAATTAAPAEPASPALPPPAPPPSARASPYALPGPSAAGEAALAKAYPHLAGGRHPRLDGSTVTLACGRRLGYCEYVDAAAEAGGGSTASLPVVVLLPGTPGSRFFTHPAIKVGRLGTREGRRLRSARVNTGGCACGGRLRVCAPQQASVATRWAHVQCHMGH